MKVFKVQPHQEPKEIEGEIVNFRMIMARVKVLIIWIVILTPIWFLTVIRFFSPKPWASETDFESYHYFCSLLLSDGLRPNIYLHPATPIHVLGCFIFKMFNVLKDNPEKYLLINYVISSIIITLFEVVPEIRTLV
jgi:hypothetical protein